MSTEVMNPPRTMLEVYQRLPEGTPVQLIQNKLIISPSPLTAHQQVLLNIAYQLKDYIKKHSTGEVFIAPYDVHLDEENVYQPDILFIAKENLHKIKENGFYGAPDLVIEILSPSTAQYDKKEKKAVYEKYGVKEYWIVDPKTKSAEGFSLKDGKFESLANDNQELRLQVLMIVLEF